VYNNFTGPACLQCACAIFGAAVVVKAQTHLGRYHLVRWHRTAHGLHDFE
jgi:hypothetical protein